MKELTNFQFLVVHPYRPGYCHDYITVTHDRRWKAITLEKFEQKSEVIPTNTDNRYTILIKVPVQLSCEDGHCTVLSGSFNQQDVSSKQELFLLGLNDS